MNVNRKIIYAAAVAIALIWPAKFARTAYVPLEIFENVGNGSIGLLNTHSQELETVKYKDDSGHYLKDGIAELNYLLRCRMTGEETDMSLKLIELAAKIQEHFNADHIDIISAYRSPALNFSLRSHGHRVARESLHMRGMAMDIKVPGVSTRAVRDYAKTLKAGGVGYYGSRFVHIDVGEVRYW